MQFKEDFFSLCEIASGAGVKLIPVLWSFEAMMSSPWALIGQNQAYHKCLLRLPKNLQALERCDAFVEILKLLVSE